MMCHALHSTFNQRTSELKSHLIHQDLVATTMCCIFNCKIECFRAGRPDANAARILLTISFCILLTI
jgi:hypothetical protein